MSLGADGNESSGMNSGLLAFGGKGVVSKLSTALKVDDWDAGFDTGRAAVSSGYFASAVKTHVVSSSWFSYSRVTDMGWG